MKRGRRNLEKGKLAEKLSITLPASLLEWLDTQPGKNRSEKIRIILKNVSDLQNAIDKS